MSLPATSDIGTLLRSVPTARRRELLQLCLLMPAAAAAEMVMLAAIVPILAILGGGNSGQTMLPLFAWIEGASPTSPLAAAIILFAAATIAAAALRLFLAWATVHFSARLGHDLNLAIQNRLLHQPYLFHVSTNSSRSIASLEKVDHLVVDLAQRTLQGVSAAIISLAVIATLLWVDPLSAAAAAILIVLLYSGTSLLFRRKLEASSATMANAYERRIQRVQESMGGIRDVIIDRSQTAHLDAFASVDDPFMRARADAIFLSAAPRYLVEAIGLCLIALLGLYLAGQPGGLPAALPVLGALALGAQRLLPLSNQVYSGLVGLTSARPILRDVADILKLPGGEQGKEFAPLEFHKNIIFQDVTFRFEDRSEAAVSHIDFTIPHGARTAIVGPTGAGKSTLADLLMGLIEPTEGQITVDGIALACDALIAWRKSIAHVPQSIFLADTTIARNIALAPTEQEPDMGRVKDAATKAHLGAFIASLPDGYDTLVGERGAKLSGGQRQRLAIARAIYRQAPLLVLDEATSALDDDTEGAILSSLDQLNSDGCTIVIVAHRQSTIERCDLVLQLDHGKLVQSGAAPRANQPEVMEIRSSGQR